MWGGVQKVLHIINVKFHVFKVIGPKELFDVVAEFGDECWTALPCRLPVQCPICRALGGVCEVWVQAHDGQH